MPDVRKLKDKAADLMAKRRFDKAAETYAELCGLEPGDLGLRQRLGDAQRQGGHVREAVATYQQVADRFARQGLLLKAIAVNKVILEVDPSHTATQATLATLYAQRQARAPSTPAPAAPRAPAAVAIKAPPEAIELPPEDVELELEAEPLRSTPPAAGADVGRLTPLEDLAAPSPQIELEAAPADAAPTPELSLDLEAEMDRQLAAPLPPKLPPTPIFSDLAPRAFVELLEQCTLLHFEPGQAIVRQGEPGKSFFVLSSGVVSVKRAGAAGDVVELAKLKEGAFFGEMALLSESPRTASVIAEDVVEALEFPAAVLAKLMSEHPSARQAVEKFTRSRLLGSVMATSPLFRPFDGENRRLLIERFLVREVADGERVIEEGKPGDGLYVVMQGRFQVRRRAPDGSPLLLSELHEGDVFGEMSLLTKEVATADVAAASAGRVLRLPRQAFDEVILTHPQILELVAKLSEERSRTTEALLGGTVTLDAEGLMLV